MKIRAGFIASIVAIVLAGCGLPEPKVAVTGTLPVELAYREAKGGLMVISGRVNASKDVAFVLDTGAPVSVLFDGPRTAGLGLDTSKARPLGDTDDPATPVGVIQGGFTWTFGGVVLSDLTAVIIPENSLPCRERFDAVDFGGVIGADLFRRFVVEIDPATKRIQLHDPAAWRAPANATSIPLTFRGGHPQVQAKVKLASGVEVDLELHVDTGSTRALSLAAGSHPSIVMPTEGTVSTACLVSGIQQERQGAPISVSLGGLPIAAPGPVYSDGTRIQVRRNGAIGMGFFGGRRIAIDYPGRRMLILG